MRDLKIVLEVLISSFLFVAYLILMFHIVIDLFRDRDLGGGKKALWVVALLLFPFFTAVIYVLTRSRGMARRAQEYAERRRAETAAFARDLGGRNSVEEIARAKVLLDQGTINNDEFATLKRDALAHVGA
ncbi:MAG: PLDc N-terminal domain-containing protein [Deltaproteobacteria bacterium]|nr:PLDc N-terminal domain-containing protein [Deltaproteobacteria bacterium]